MHSVQRLYVMPKIEESRVLARALEFLCDIANKAHHGHCVAVDTDWDLSTEDSDYTLAKQ
ncbi:hypothetical protein G3I36_24495 [Streptomyces sp. SID10362]|uniref:hypothetical protein n=1 Tax=Streptomyces sp. SID10362 TaxID=2706021 RepID=UPI0013C9383F|nr:hypothetical protein [Streptomyces sp. SID10362]NDZ74136.1 hypothetical protein [Streptomyces sp. SID10362]